MAVIKPTEDCRFASRGSVKPVGIDGDYRYYHYFKDIEESQTEISQTNQILDEAFDVKNSNSISFQLVSKSIISPDHTTKIRFFNYGTSQLVFHVEITSEKQQLEFCALVNQPQFPKELTKNEYIHLTELQKMDGKNIVAPLAFYETKERSLYFTSYVNQARCPYYYDFEGLYHKWGVFIPEPSYRFVVFSDEVTRKVMECMIAFLVHFYDRRNELGITATKISGDDFIILKEWDIETGKKEDLLKNMRMIACRDRIKIPLEEYLKLLRKEFTVLSDENILNKKSGIPIPLEIVNKGIETGLDPKNFA